MPFCGHCKNLGKEYTSHFPHKTQSKNSPLTCPELLKYVCTKCSSRNHTMEKCTKKTSTPPVVSTPVKKSSTSKYNILDQEEQCPICQCVECYCDNNYLETKTIPRDHGEELYAIVAKDYPMRAGKITGMFLEFEQIELIKMLENPALLRERSQEASDLIDAHYPLGHIDAIFRPPSVYSRSSARQTKLEEVEEMNVREEYRTRVYATDPFLHSSIIDKIVDNFILQALEPEEMYELFVNFKEFTKQVKFVKSHIEKYEANLAYEESYKYYCNYEEFSRSTTLNASASANADEEFDDHYEEFSLSDRFQDEDDEL
jgi:hypothetical protein